jgi:hypothetical protein
MGEGGARGGATRSVEETAEGEEGFNEEGHSQEGHGQKENGAGTKEGLVWRNREVVMAALLGLPVDALHTQLGYKARVRRRSSVEAARANESEVQ